MAKSIIATTPEQTSNADVQLSATINAAGDLALSFDGDDLDTANGNLEIKCDPSQVVKIIVDDFTHGGETWTLTATPQTRASPAGNWDTGSGQMWDQGSGHMTDYVTVDVTASATTSKTLKLHVKTRPRESQPDPHMQQGG